MAGGRNAKRHRMRCYACKRRKCCSGRFTLPRAPEFLGPIQFKRLVKCSCCGNTNVHSIEKERRAEQVRKDTCHCSLIPFPHEKGTIVGCLHFECDEWTEELEDRLHSVLETPRGT